MIYIDKALQTYFINFKKKKAKPGAFVTTATCEKFKQQHGILISVNYNPDIRETIYIIVWTCSSARGEPIEFR